ncbi:hypothetical protein GCM10009676_25540 [Prauserella halophila]|uniref:Uncharacterized protein n=1 Tax=Prauserella halophila TaxID=185641 RepID=A0ABN1WAV1_9PSEU|nr:hypothetical protein [Prauserella halophila]MCP2234929.1 hypothetical protein [Prauserella halophila]
MRLVRFSARPAHISPDIRAALTSLGRDGDTIGGVGLVGVQPPGMDAPVDAVAVTTHGVVVVIGVDLPDPAIRLEAPLHGVWKADGWPLVRGEDDSGTNAGNPSGEALTVSDQVAERIRTASGSPGAAVGTVVAVGPFAEHVEQPAGELSGPVRIVYPTSTSLLASVVSLASAPRPFTVDQARAVITALSPDTELEDEALAGEGFATTDAAAAATGAGPSPEPDPDGASASGPAPEHPGGPLADPQADDPLTDDADTETLDRTAPPGPEGAAASGSAASAAAATPAPVAPSLPAASSPAASSPAASPTPPAGSAPVTPPPPTRAQPADMQPSASTDTNVAAGSAPAGPATTAPQHAPRPSTPASRPGHAEQPGAPQSGTPQSGTPRPGAPQSPRTPPASAASGQAPAVPSRPGGAAPQPRRRRSPAQTWRWIAAGAVFAVALVVIITFTAMSGGDDGDQPVRMRAGGLEFTQRAAQLTEECAAHAVGDLSVALTDGGCTELRRGSFDTTAGGTDVAVSVAALTFTDEQAAQRFLEVADTPGTGTIRDLATTSDRWAPPAPDWSGAAYVNDLEGTTVRLVQASPRDRASVESPEVADAAEAALGLVKLND